MKDFELCISPVETYKSPDVPVYESDNSAILKRLPARWQKSAKVLACISIVGTLALGTLTLSGCSSVFQPSPPQRIVYPLSQDIFDYMHDLGSPYGRYSGYSESDLMVRAHHGGAASSIYVVNLTEQEVLGIVRARLEAAGLNFNATPPQHTINSCDNFSRGPDGVGLSLFDEQKNVAIASTGLSVWRDWILATEEAFARQTDITVGVFASPGQSLGSAPQPRDEQFDESVERSRPTLVRQLINRIDIFIFHMQSEGILGQYPNIDVRINETPVEFGDFPILINNHKMVPAEQIFEQLGMTVGSDERGRMTAVRDDISICLEHWVRGYGANMRVNNRFVGMDIPVITHNNQILVPLQYVARTIGADVEWDEIAREIRITTN